MILRLLRGAVRLHPARLALVVLSTAMGAGIAAALGSVALQAEERIARELRSFGANVVVEPVAASAPGGAPAGAASLQEADLARVLTIFWRHNVVGVAPSLTAPAAILGARASERALVAGVWFDRRLPRAEGGEPLRAGVVPLFPYWEVDGRWPSEGSGGEVVVGRALATRLGVRVGDRIGIDAGHDPARSAVRPPELEVVGLLATGGFEEDEVLLELGEEVPIAGTPFTLHYDSTRVTGRTDLYSMEIPLSEATSCPNRSLTHCSTKRLGARITHQMSAPIKHALKRSISNSPLRGLLHRATKKMVDFNPITHKGPAADVTA
jgi:putative ABC transport system permease protein